MMPTGNTGDHLITSEIMLLLYCAPAVLCLIIGRHPITDASPIGSSIFLPRWADYFEAVETVRRIPRSCYVVTVAATGATWAFAAFLLGLVFFAAAFGAVFFAVAR